MKRRKRERLFLETRGGQLQSLLEEILRQQRKTNSPVPNERSVLLYGAILLTVFLIIFSAPRIMGIVSTAYNCGITLGSGHDSQHSVALVDQLSKWYPDPSFVQNVSAASERAGYNFEYFPPDAVTMDFFLKLPNRGFSIIILRTHGILASHISGIVTSDPYSPSYHGPQQILDHVVDVNVAGNRYFALGPGFISNDMCGQFQGSVIMAMFCNGTQDTSLASAFIGRGAGAFIGWSDVVTVSQTDLAFEMILGFVLRGDATGSSTQRVMELVGPTYPRLLSYSAGSIKGEVEPWQQYWYVISAGAVAAVLILKRFSRYDSRGKRRWYSSRT